MNPKVKEKWLAALRSGGYNQGRWYLHPTEDTFCCLGVLCDLYGKETGQGWWRPGPDGLSDFECENGDVAFGALPHAVAEWAGFSGDSYRDPLLPARPVRAFSTLVGPVDSCADYNDDGYSFAEIADAIEENL